MSQEYATYNRDQNVSGSVSSGSFVPEYGSMVSFEYADPYMYGMDNKAMKISKGLNSTTIKFDLKFSNKTEDEAKSLLHLLEEVDLSESGNLEFNTLSASGVELAFPTGNVYKNINNMHVADYAFSAHNGLFDLNLNLIKNSHSYIFDWDGSAYLDTGTFHTGWTSGVNYEEFDVVYYTGYVTGGYENATNDVNRIDSFYYCKSGHLSEGLVGHEPTGTGNFWGREFFFKPDDDVSIDMDKSPTIDSFQKSFIGFNKKSGNENLIRGLTLSFKNRSDKETRAIMHFIEKHENARPFRLTLPQLYNKKKYFVAKSMKHTFVYKDCNDIEIVVDEIIRYVDEIRLENFQNA